VTLGPELQERVRDDDERELDDGEITTATAWAAAGDFPVMSWCSAVM
jgi:hypothetical protein